MIDTLAVVGATGAVGRIILEQLVARRFPARRIKLLASARSAGREVTVVPRRPHRYREAPRPARGPISGVEPDLQRLLQGNAIERVVRCAAVETGDRNLAAL